MGVWFWVAVGLFVVCLYLGWALVSMIRSNGWLAKGYRHHEQRAAAWEDFATQMGDLAKAKEGILAAIDGIDFVMEHPDPIEQRKANRVMADLQRVAAELQQARALKAKKPEGVN